MAHAVDIHLGKRLRHRRWMIGMTQGELADILGIRFQQVQKYESGANRIAASRLWDIAEALRVPIGYFYDGLPAQAATMPDANISEASMMLQFYGNMPDEERETLRTLAEDTKSQTSH